MAAPRGALEVVARTRLTPSPPPPRPSSLYHGTHISFDPYAAASQGFGGRHPHGGRKHRVKETLAGGGRINLTFRRIVDRKTGLPP